MSATMSSALSTADEAQDPLLCGPRSSRERPAISTFDAHRALTGASGFFFEREDQLCLVTSRHVFIDEPSKHFSGRIEIELHVDPDNFTRFTGLFMLLYRKGQRVWRDATDSGGEIEVAAIELERVALPQHCALEAFTPAHLPYAQCSPY
jgi:hypothetical protein